MIRFIEKCFCSNDVFGCNVFNVYTFNVPQWTTKNVK